MTQAAGNLLSDGEPAPVRRIEPTGPIQMLLTADHASNRIPRVLDGMGVTPEVLDRHIAWDPGSREVTEILAGLTGASALLCEYSRLVVDCNRRLDDPTLILPVADGETIPANQDLDAAARAQRVEAVHRPYHDAVQAEIDRRVDLGEHPALVSIHSFTPVLQGVRRPWEAGVLWDKDGRIPLPLMEALREEGLVVGDNEPYSGRAHWDYTIDHHAESAGIPHAVIEIRHDLILQPEGQQLWAERLARVLVPILEHMPRPSTARGARAEDGA